MRNKKLVYTFLLFFVLPGCKSYLQEKRRVEFAKYEKAANSENWALIELSEWEYKDRASSVKWTRDYEMLNIDTGIHSASGVRLDSSGKSYECIEKYGKDTLLYVGRWHYVDKIGKTIRVFACGFVPKYESMDERNKEILYKPLTQKPVKNHNWINSFSACNYIFIKWHDKIGRNAYYDLKTGTIKQAKE